MDSQQVSVDFARAWDNHQGNIAQGVAERILNYAEENKIKLSSVLDIDFGSSNLLGYLKDNGLKCFGTETRQGMYEYSKEKYPEITYYLTKSINEIPMRGKVDLVTCTHDIVNYLETFDEWVDFFKNVTKHLNGHGMFIFDFYTKDKLQNWNETTFTSSSWLDCLTNVSSGLYDKTVINYTYYINYQNYMIKTRDIMVESYYETDQIVAALKKCGLKNVQLVDKNLNPLSSTNGVERIYVIARRK